MKIEPIWTEYREYITPIVRRNIPTLEEYRKARAQRDADKYITVAQVFGCGFISIFSAGFLADIFPTEDTAMIAEAHTEILACYLISAVLLAVSIRFFAKYIKLRKKYGVR